MDILTFIAEIIKAISWPLAVVIIVLSLRKPISKLIPLLNKLKYGDLELDFNKQVSELTEKAAESIPELLEITPAEQEKEKVYDDINFSPRTAVIESWLKLEDAAINVIKNREEQINKYSITSPVKIAKTLEKYEIFDNNKAQMFHKLRNLRNEAAHNYNFYIDPETAKNYVNLANSLTSYIFKKSQNGA